MHKAKCIHLNCTARPIFPYECALVTTTQIKGWRTVPIPEDFSKRLLFPSLMLRVCVALFFTLCEWNIGIMFFYLWLLSLYIMSLKSIDGVVCQKHFFHAVYCSAA